MVCEGTSNTASPNFWPNAALQASLDMGRVLDAAYLRDAPKPLQARALKGARKAGALQSAP